jgi:hypothetical protein
MDGTVAFKGVFEALTDDAKQDDAVVMSVTILKLNISNE